MKIRLNGFRALLWASLTALGLLAGGCGLGTAGLVLLFTSGGDEETKTTTTIVPPPPPNLLFHDDFESGLGQWDAQGTTPPSITNDAADTDNTTLFLIPGGSSAQNGEAVTLKAFPVDPGVAFITSLSVKSSGVDPAQGWMGFKSRFAADLDPGLLAGLIIDCSLQRVDFVVDGVAEANRVLTDENWHDVMVFLQPDGHAAFYLDGALVYLSAAPVNPDVNLVPLAVGGSLGATQGRIQVDDVKVTGSGPVPDILFADGFAFDFGSRWSIASTGTAPVPLWDETGSGFPLPAVNPGGNATGVGRALTTSSFDIATEGAQASADIQITQIGSSDQKLAFGFCAQSSLSGAVSLMAGFRLVPGTTTDEVQFILDTGGGEILVDTIGLDTDVHRYEVVVRSDRFVEFYVDGAFQALSAQPLGSAFTNQPVLLEGQVVSGTPRFDNVSVLSPPMEGVPTGSVLTALGTAPGAVKLHTAVWDEEGGRMIFLGGEDDGGAAVAGVYEFTLDDTGAALWTQLAPTGTGPNAPKGHTAVWDPNHRMMVVFGGRDGTSSALLGQAWGLDFSSSDQGEWAALGGVSTGPSDRWKHAAAFDTCHQHMIVFGGEDATGPRLDIHILDLSTYSPGGDAGAWSVPSTTGGPPSARYGHAAVFDGARRRMIMIGGTGLAAMIPQNEMAWFLTVPLGAEDHAWSQPSAPPAGLTPRMYSALCLDPGRRNLLILGGHNQFSSTDYDELWMIDLALDSWWLSPVAGVPHDGQQGMSAVLHPQDRSVLALGGETSTTVQSSLTRLWFKDNTNE